MFLNFLFLVNFRLHRSTNLQFSEGLNYIVGGNGQGKTTILESIYYISTTKSFSANSDSEVVNFEEDYFEVKGKIIDLTEQMIVIRYNREENRKYYSLNGKLVISPQDVIGKFPVVLLSPADSKITEEAPQERRKFIDSIISQISKTYLSDLLEYKKILKQRSSLLFQIKERVTADLYIELDAWTERLIQIGVQLIRARKSFINEFNQYVKNVYQQIMNGLEEPEIIYETVAHESDDDLVDAFKQELKNQKENEFRRAVNLVGPHRDDLRFLINGKDLRVYGSQGQHKTFQVALRFAEYFFLQKKLNKNPFFLLDDIFGELDKYRSSKISEHLSELGQTFITLTDFSNLKELQKTSRDQILFIENGELVDAR